MREVYSRQKAAEHAVQWTKEGLCVVLDSATRSAVQNMSALTLISPCDSDTGLLLPNSDCFSAANQEAKQTNAIRTVDPSHRSFNRGEFFSETPFRQVTNRVVGNN
ncbi:Hypothetical predicted protein [Scomber scombrus]|uniref:Uncharacterized protein n=1 Tax=Scomber scombrus TaxID=13677 RepID=A0AAV1NT11_SCOSC